jgi:hypothetical protein
MSLIVPGMLSCVDAIVEHPNVVVRHHIVDETDVYVLPPSRWCCAGMHRPFGVRFAPHRYSLDAHGFDPRMSPNIRRPVLQNRGSPTLALIANLVPSCHLDRPTIVDA